MARLCKSTPAADLESELEVVELDRLCGGHFFDAATMRFFKSRLLEGLHKGPGGVYFCTSERYGAAPRTYRVRRVNEAESRSLSAVESAIDEFFDTAAQAKARAKWLARGVESLERM